MVEGRAPGRDGGESALREGGGPRGVGWWARPVPALGGAAVRSRKPGGVGVGTLGQASGAPARRLRFRLSRLWAAGLQGRALAELTWNNGLTRRKSVKRSLLWLNQAPCYIASLWKCVFGGRNCTRPEG